MKKVFTGFLLTILLLIVTIGNAATAPTAYGNGYTLDGICTKNMLSYQTDGSKITQAVFKPYGYSTTSKVVNSIEIWLHVYQNGLNVSNESWYNNFTNSISMETNSSYVWQYGDTFSVVADHVGRDGDYTLTHSSENYGF